MIKAILTKPLDGNPEGSTVEYSKADFEMLEKLGAVARAPEGTEDAPAETKAVEVKAQEPAENKMQPEPSNKAAPKAAAKPAKAD